MNILLTGASGLIGSALQNSFTAGGHQVTRLSRFRGKPEQPQAFWNPDAGSIDLSAVGTLDAVIHLAGESIAERWSPQKKVRIRDSRVKGTRLLCETLAALPRSPRVLACASATGYYGHRGDEWLDERSASGAGFLADVCREWEAAAQPASQRGIRVAHLRFGVVLSTKGGALAKMLTPFRLGLGGKLGHGRQYLSWIALDDVVNAVHHVLANESLSGPVNLVSPNPVTNLEFTKTLGAILHRPTFFTMPAFAVKLVFGEMGEEALLASARVKPRRLEQAGFAFQFPQLDPALRHLLAK